jgi:hypothetical protein
LDRESGDADVFDIAAKIRVISTAYNYANGLSCACTFYSLFLN